MQPVLRALKNDEPCVDVRLILTRHWSEPLQTGPFGRSELSRVLGELRFKFVRRSVAKRRMHAFGVVNIFDEVR